LRTVPVGVAYPGVEVHATLLDNLLTDTYFRIDLINSLLTTTLILVLGLLLGFTLPHLKGIYGAVLAAALLVVYFFAHRWMVNSLLTWTSFIYVAVVIALVWGGVTLFRFLVTDKDKRFIKGAFQQYLAPEVINQLMENPDRLKLGGERQVVTAFFSDVQGFSTISEKLDPVALVQLMQEYLTEMSNIVMKYGGTIDKYIGDAIVAFFGAPVHFEDHATKAVLAALEMQTRLEEMRQNWRKEGRAEDMMLYQRIGLNTGPMVVGNMGSQSRFNYTMMGNAVNLAARLEGANKFYHTYAMCTEFTMDVAKEQVEFRELDSVAVKGVTQPVRVFELIGTKGSVPEEKMKGIAYFQKGLELYRKRQFEEGAKYFNAVYKFIPNDGPAKEFIERCKQYLQHPPDEHWDGSFHATEK
jgi:adenylate cyclase